MKKLLPWVLLLVGIYGCHPVGPDYRRPVPIGSETTRGAFTESSNDAFERSDLQAHWWQLYNDPVLDALVDKALVRNTDLRVAAATLAQARANLDRARAERSPQTSLKVDPSYAHVSADSLDVPAALPAGPVYDGEFAVSYNMDLFGRLRRGVEAANAMLEASRAAFDLARINVAAETARAYSQACAAGLRLAVQDRAIDTARSTLNLAQRRFASGLAGANDVVRARAQLNQTIADKPALAAAQWVPVFLLATLIGDPPETLPPDITSCKQPPVIARAIPIGDGAALLRRRPDVRQAERTLAADVARIGATTAALYPSVSLGGSIGTTAANSMDIINQHGFRWSVGPLLTWTFPNQSIARAEIASANALAAAQLARFDGTVLTALREVESALVTLARQLDTVNALTDARNDAAIAAHNVRTLYAGGVGNFLDVLDAERTEIQTDSTLARAMAAVSNDQVQLFMALGGGWQEDAPVEPENIDRAEISGAAGR